MAWYEENREHLIIAADGSVIANPDRIQLFMDYQNVEEIVFNQAFDTSRMTDMSFMFTGCRELKQLELGNFEMGYFPSTTDMFLYCNSLDSEIYEGIWDGN